LNQDSNGRDKEMPAKAKYTEVTTFFTTPEQKAWLQAMAEEHGVSVSQILRACIANVHNGICSGHDGHDCNGGFSL
jgi:hypothetical protein